MTKLEKLYSIIENSRDVGVKLPKGVLQQVEELEEGITEVGIEHSTAPTIPTWRPQVLTRSLARVPSSGVCCL